MPLYLEIRDARGAVLVPLDADRLTVGGPTCDVAVEGAQGEWVEIRLREGKPWASRLPGAPPLRYRGSEVEEAALEQGDEGSIGGTRFSIRAEGLSWPSAAAGEAAADAAVVALGAVAVVSGLAPPPTIRKWREEILRREGEYDGTAAAREILSGVAGGAGHPELLPAAVRLQRDAIAAGAAPRRRASLAMKKAAAFTVSHVFVFLLYGLVVLVGLLVLRRLLDFDLYRFAGI